MTQARFEIIAIVVVAYFFGWYFRGVAERRQRRDRNAQKTWRHRQQQRLDTQVNIVGRFRNLLMRSLPADQFRVVSHYHPGGQYEHEISVYKIDSSSHPITVNVDQHLRIYGHLGSEHFSYQTTPDNIRKLESEIKLFCEHP